MLLECLINTMYVVLLWSHLASSIPRVWSTPVARDAHPKVGGFAPAFWKVTPDHRSHPDPKTRRCRAIDRE